ncbi:galactose-3-O-sulfotransferase 2-like [Mya arenaria]|uniref:galactose-3-O-sulfotransferase 2-like n=1 Tax=Mya arenaria TaxID=6604 RepID=UPI0022DF06AC|nr:galactose-3-O-sulfotransferase 2-like [Mya arenaria]
MRMLNRRNALGVVVIIVAIVLLETYVWNWHLSISKVSIGRKTRDIVFLKVHKTGSSTIANILLRFGYSRNLNFALPRKRRGEIRYNYFGDVGETLNRSGVMGSKNSDDHFNVLFNHVVFNWTAFVRLFHKRTTTYVTMIREPASQFRSAMLFFLHDKIYKAATANLTKYLENPSLFEPEDAYVSFTDNRQALDLGVPPKRVRQPVYIKTYIKLLDKAFDLVLITEYFDESLVLLRRKMSLSTKDILYLKKNIAYKQFNFNFSAHDYVLLRRWAPADHMIYEHFHSKFIRTLKSEPSVVDEVMWYRTVLRNAQDFCSGSDARSHLDIGESLWSEPFTVTSLDCAYMRLGELEFLDKILHESPR